MGRHRRLEAQGRIGRPGRGWGWRLGRVGAAPGRGCPAECLRKPSQPPPRPPTASPTPLTITRRSPSLSRLHLGGRIRATTLGERQETACGGSAAASHRAPMRESTRAGPWQAVGDGGGRRRRGGEQRNAPPSAEAAAAALACPVAAAAADVGVSAPPPDPGPALADATAAPPAAAADDEPPSAGPPPGTTPSGALPSSSAFSQISRLVCTAGEGEGV